MTTPPGRRGCEGSSCSADYHPLMLIFVSAAIGIIADRYFSISWISWWTLILASAGFGLRFWGTRMPVWGSVVLTLFAVSLSGLWHHVHWRLIDARDVSLFASAAPQPMHLYGQLASQTKWILDTGSEASWSRRRGPRSRFTVRVTGVRDKQTRVAARGLVEVYVSGQVSGLVIGDQLELDGWLNPVKPPSNPGQFNFQMFLRRQKKRCLLQVDHPDCIQVVEQGTTGPWAVVSWARLSLDRLVWKYLSPRQAPLGSAMLLGNRQQLDHRWQQRFLTSGTMHLLAISGLHVGILAGFLTCLPRLGIVSRRSGLLITVLFVAGYACLVEFRPPVLRAAILISVFCYCKWIGRPAFSVNSLSLAGIIVMILNPADLFNPGAQLSFIAVGTLMHLHRAVNRRRQHDPIEKLIANTRSPWVKFVNRTCRATRATFVASGMIWLLTLPLVALTFHVVSPIALVTNPLLMAPISCALFCGFGILVFGWLFPPLAAIFGCGANLSFSFILNLVEVAHRVPGGHFWMAGPTPSAALIFYVATILVFVFRFGKPARIRIALVAIGWLLAGWMGPAWVANHHPDRVNALRLTVIDVGHGSCVLLQLPGGKNVLYDCGSFGSEQRSTQNAAGVLWYDRIAHIDTVVISHADSDHFNALSGLARRFSIGRLLVSHQMLADSAPRVDQLLADARDRGIEVRAISKGQDVIDQPGCQVRVIGPAADARSSSDNANSIVLYIECFGYRILLPGDLEMEGMERLLNSPRLPCDLVMAPHHGSSGSCPREFLDWSRPRVAIISGHALAPFDDFRIEAESLGCRVLHTGRDGAIRIKVPRDGKATVRRWLHEPW